MPKSKEPILMRRSAPPACAAFAAATAIATAVVATAVPSGAQAVTSHDGAATRAGAKSMTVRVRDARGDVSTKTTTNLADIDGSADGFKPGKGTVVSPSDADKAMDLTEVTYRVVRGGAAPVLTVTYRVAGPFTYAHEESSATAPPAAPDAPGPASGTSATQSFDVDGLETVLGGGRYTLELLSDGHPGDNGLFRNNSRHHQIACRGIRSQMKVGTNTATQTVPLSCLTRLGIKGSKLRAVSAHYVIRSQFTMTGTGANTTFHESGSASVGTDSVPATRHLPLTPSRR